MDHVEFLFCFVLRRSHLVVSENAAPFAVSAPGVGLAPGVRPRSEGAWRVGQTPWSGRRSLGRRARVATYIELL